MKAAAFKVDSFLHRMNMEFYPKWQRKKTYHHSLQAGFLKYTWKLPKWPNYIMIPKFLQIVSKMDWIQPIPLNNSKRNLKLPKPLKIGLISSSTMWIVRISVAKNSLENTFENLSESYGKLVKCQKAGPRLTSKYHLTRTRRQNNNKLSKSYLSCY